MDLLSSAPKRGDIIWIDLDPKKGREQKGHRPALVLSHLKHNEAFDLVIIVPITRQKKGYAIEVELPASCSIQGVVLTNQIQTIDWRERNTAFGASADDKTILEVIKRINILIE